MRRSHDAAPSHRDFKRSDRSRASGSSAASVICAFVPPIWVHFGLGLAGCALVGRFVKKPWAPWLGWGLVWGSVAPDTDLIVADIASLATGFDTHVGKAIHRSVTHGFPIVAALVILGAVLWAARRPRAGPFFVGMGSAILLFHLTPDLFYLVPLKPFAPFDWREVGPYGLPGYHFWKQDFDDFWNNVINGIDFLGESFYYMTGFALAVHYGVKTRFVRWLPWIAGVNFVIFGAIIVIFAGTMTYDGFLIPSYAAGFPFLFVSTLAVPWFLRDTWLRVGGATAPASVAPDP